MSRLPDPVVDALRSTRYVTGYTHGFYRYPARFTPEFARALIRQYTVQGDIVLDPFMGGGTAIVEALAEGRQAIGLDLNPLAHFVTLVKTTPLSGADADELCWWADSIASDPPAPPAVDTADPRLRNAPHELLATLAPFAAAAAELRPARRRRFARCVLLRVGQWALESQKRPALPTPAELRERVVDSVQEMLDGLNELIETATNNGTDRSQFSRSRRLTHTTTAMGYWLRGVRNAGVPRLVLTSPPYPAVHVLYHRWQVLGRRETPAPFWLADLEDGHGESYYRFGSRTPTGLQNYFDTLQRAFRTVGRVMTEETVVAQLVAFSDIEAQLPQYLADMDAAGFDRIQSDTNLEHASFWRRVPHRRWYMRVQDRDGAVAAANEVLLLHRRRP